MFFCAKKQAKKSRFFITRFYQKNAVKIRSFFIQKIGKKQYKKDTFFCGEFPQ